ncbi:MAG: hypothetical protein ACLFNM_00250 [Candidatus Woesearchaeota archaeon]
MNTQLKKKLLLYSFLALALLFSLSPVLASTTVASSYSPIPFFEVEFEMHDAPVTILASEIVSLDSEKVYSAQCVQEDDYNRSFTCMSQVYLFNGEYEFELTSQDTDGNEKTFTKAFEVESNPMDAWITSPANTFYASQSQDSAVRNQTPFNVTFQTEHESRCRLVENNELLELGILNEEDLFSLPTSIRVDDELGEDEQAHTHELLVVSSSDDVSDLEPQTYLVAKEFTSDSFQTNNNYLLLCQTGQDGDYTYHANPFYIGYDSSGVSFSSQAQPQTIFDILNISTTQKIVSTSQDLLLCSYDFLQNPSPNYQPTSDLYTGQKATSIFDFSSSYNKAFNFVSQEFIIGDTYNYTLNTTCYDLAGHKQSKVQDFSIHLNTTLRANLQEYYFSKKQPTLTLQTNTLSACKYVFDYEDEQLADNITNNTTLNETHEFELPVSLDDGAYPIDIYCLAADSFFKTFTFYIDTTEPAQPVFNSTKNHCGSDVQVTFAEPINDTVRYIISINEQENTTFLLENYTTSFTDDELDFEFPSSIDTNINSTYVVTAYAQDRAGHNSSSSSFSVTQRSADYLYCDDVPPVITLDVQEQPSGYLINATCADVGSGCTQTVSYSFIDSNESCTTFNQSTSYSMPISSPTDTRFCYQGSDVAGLQTNGSVLLSDVATPFTLSQSDIAEQDITLISPRQGSSSTKTIDLEVQTTYDATCTQGLFESTHPTNKQDWFASLETFTVTNSTTHKQTIDASSHPAFVSNKTEEFNQWVVVCDFGDEVFASKQFSLGYSEYEAECTSDDDCKPEEYCSTSGNCRDSTQDSDSTDSSISFLGLTFIILGLLFMIGGVAFIYHSQKEKSQQNKQQRTYQQTAQQQRQEELSRKEQIARQQKYAQLMQKRKQLQEETRSKRVQERSSSRKSLLSAFSSSSDNDGDADSKPSFQAKNKKAVSKSPSEDDTPSLEKISLDKQPTSSSIPLPSSKTFKSLSSLIDKAHTEDVSKTQLSKHATTVPRHITPDLFMHLFAKKIPVYASDTPALLSLLKALLHQEKLTSEDVKSVLSRLAKKGYIQTKNISSFYQDVVGGKT